MPTLQEQLDAYTERYREHLRLFESDGIITPEEQAQLDNISSMIERLGASLATQRSQANRESMATQPPQANQDGAERSEQGGNAAKGGPATDPTSEAAASAESPRRRRPVDRRRVESFEVSDNYNAFREQVEAWLARQVMSRTEVEQEGGGRGPIRRERELVEQSNLREVYQRVHGVSEPGEHVRLGIHLIAGEYRYERVEFSTPGLVVTDPIDIEGRDVEGIRRRIQGLERERAERAEAAMQQVQHAVNAAQHAVLEGSRDYEPDRVTRQFQGFIEAMAAIGRILDPPEPFEAGIERSTQLRAIRELEEYTEQQIQEANRRVQQVEEVDRELERLHRELGEDYQPGESPRMPDVGRRSP